MRWSHVSRGEGENILPCVWLQERKHSLYIERITQFLMKLQYIKYVLSVREKNRFSFLTHTHTQTGKNILRLLQSKANHVLFFVNEPMPMLYLWSTKWKEREDKQSWLRPLVHCSISRPPCPPPPPLHLSSLPFNPHTDRPHHRPILSRFPDVWPRTLH